MTAGSGEALEDWCATQPERLDRARREPARRLKQLAARLRTELRKTAPGRLADSVFVETTEDSVEVYSTAPQAAILETGGTIHGRPWLAIPLAAIGNTSNGGPRYDGTRMFVLRSRSGDLFLASHVSGGIEIRYKLQHSVQIRGTGWFSRGVDAATDGFDEEVADAVSGLIAGAG